MPQNYMRISFVSLIHNVKSNNATYNLLVDIDEGRSADRFVKGYQLELYKAIVTNFLVCF